MKKEENRHACCILIESFKIFWRFKLSNICLRMINWPSDKSIMFVWKSSLQMSSVGQIKVFIYLMESVLLSTGCIKHNSVYLSRSRSYVTPLTIILNYFDYPVSRDFIKIIFPSICLWRIHLNNFIYFCFL